LHPAPHHVSHDYGIEDSGEDTGEDGLVVGKKAIINVDE
jgi:hypothetical protein